MNIIKPGSVVSIQGQNDIKVVAVYITQSGVRYECGWWDNRSYNTRYFDEAQVETNNATKISVGYE